MAAKLLDLLCVVMHVEILELRLANLQVNV